MKSLPIKARGKGKTDRQTETDRQTDITNPEDWCSDVAVPVSLMAVDHH